MLLLLESDQPFHHGRDPARGRILQPHREQVVVHLEQRLLGAIAAAAGRRRRRGELHAGEREQRRVGLPCEERDHARRLLEREEPADCVRKTFFFFFRASAIGWGKEASGSGSGVA